MNAPKKLRYPLAWKLFLSYLLVILVGVAVLAAAAEVIVPGALTRHMGTMMQGDTVNGSGGMMGMMNGSDGDLLAGFRAAFNETLLLAALAAVLAAGVVSFVVASRITAPVRILTAASRRIAAGQFAERVPVQAGRGGQDELGLLADSFNIMAAQLEQTEAMRRRLIGDVAHELRTPLTTIQGSMEGLIDGVLAPETTTFQQVYLEAKRLGRLVNDLQELSRVEAGAYSLMRRPVILEELTRELGGRMQLQFAEKGVALQIECSPTLPPVSADPDRITQVLTNLLGNALQYTREGGSVAIRCASVGKTGLPEFPGWDAPDGSWIVVSIHDTGVGIAPEHLPYVFDRFFRVDPSRSRAGGGSGIGLTIARSLVEAHGGRIWVESKGIGMGSVFSFCLPSAKSLEDDNSLSFSR